MRLKQIVALTALAALTASCSAGDGIKKVEYGTATWHDGFLWTDADTTWAEKTMEVKFNADALEVGKPVRLRITDAEGQPLRDDVQVSLDGKILRDNLIEVKPDGQKVKEVTLGISFLPEAETGNHQFHLEVVPGGVERINHAQVLPGKPMNLGPTVSFEVVMNPLKFWLLVALAVFAVVVVLARIAMHRKTFGGSAKKSVTVTDKKGDIIFGPRTVKMGGLVEVLFTDRVRKQSLMDRFFRGEIKYVVDPAFASEIKLTQGKKREIRIAGVNYTPANGSMQYSDMPFTATDTQTKNKVEFS